MVKNVELLTKTEKRTVLALVAEKQRLIGEVNEVEEALTELSVTLAEAHRLPPDSYAYNMEKNGDLYLACEIPGEKPAALPEGEHK